MDKKQAVEDAVNTLIRMWSEWEADANQAAQQHQSNEAYFDTMIPQVEAVVGGVVDDVLSKILSDVSSVLVNMDNLAELWGDESVFRSCRDRLRSIVRQ